MEIHREFIWTKFLYELPQSTIIANIIVSIKIICLLTIYLTPMEKLEQRKNMQKFFIDQNEQG